MGKNSEIEWTHHTFNPWWGCTKVSPACRHCYAETWAKRVGQEIWGKASPRRLFGEKHWSQPLQWNDDAKRQQTRFRVFCASMSDVFETRKELDQERKKLWELISQTPFLDWLLLTKRPQNIIHMAPWDKDWPANVWLGTTVEDQKRADERLPHLLRHPAAVRFLSCEPLLGSLDLSVWADKKKFHPINWVIAGGESGAQARPMHPEWARALRDYCAKKKIAFHFKQWGHWVPSELLTEKQKRMKSRTLKADVPIEMIALGKKEAGRLLDGKTYDELPLEAAFA
jgi:protein gp37